MNKSRSPKDATIAAEPPRHGAWVWSLLLAAVALRVLFYFLSVNNGGDALDRVEKTAAWLQRPWFPGDFGAWLPLHFWMIAGLSFITRDVELAGRLLSLACGIASVWVFWRCARELAPAVAAPLSLAAFCFYTLHVGYSATSSAEVPFLFFLLLALWALLLYSQRGRLLLLIGAGLSMTLAAGIRFEAWVVMAGMALALLLFPPTEQSWARRIAAVTVFAAAAGLFPAFWMAYLWTAFGHPLHFVVYNRVWVAEQLAFGQTSLAYRLALPPAVVLLSLSPVAFLAGLFGWWRGIRSRGERWLATVLLFFSAVQLYQILSGGVMSFARYTLTAGILLALFSGPGLAAAVARLQPVWMPRLAPALVAVLALNLLAVFALGEMRSGLGDRISSLSPRLRFRHHISDVGNFLRPRLRPGDPVVFDNYNVESSLLATASGLPLQPGEHVFLAVRRKPAELQPFLQDRRPRYLVYARGGDLNAVLTLPTDCSSATVWDTDFRCVFSNQTYSIFELTYR